MEKYFMIKIAYSDDIVSDFAVEDLENILYEELRTKHTRLPNYSVTDISETIQKLNKKWNARSIRKRLGLEEED